MTPTIHVYAPFQAVGQDSLEARAKSGALPHAELSSALRPRRTAGADYEAELCVPAAQPREAKVTAVQRVETPLTLLAVGN